MALLSKTVRLFLQHSVPLAPAHPILVLDDDSRIGRGSKRDCHRHPTDDDLCIKVARRPHRPDAQQPSIVEWYCAQSLDTRHVPYEHRARCHGWVNTNRGPGLVVERIRNANGQASRTLAEQAGDTGLSEEELKPLFDSLHTWVIEHGVPVTDLNSGNLVLREVDGQRRLVLIDGIGGQKVKLKFVMYRRSAWFARRLSRNRWPRLARVAHEEIAAARRLPQQANA
ncbi:YrbL family protein [Salinisphaera sp. Q1T1-3]|uniref:YrbL family protein n=1 Tax=Salinisphaera sp. Q1T1-3 TaxID=2321229 RepID=UPI001314A810|nr:YrbL family protein [Salinisphaera sp. Q1T1-3]